MRYAIVTDIHANYLALKAVAEEVGVLRAQNPDTPIKYWFLGDLVGYGPEPVECIQWLRSTARIGERWVAGNHDEWMIHPQEVSSDAWASLKKHQQILEQPEHRELYHWFQEQVRLAIQEEKRSLVKESFAEGKGMALFVHASVNAIFRRLTYLYPWQRYLLQEELMRVQQEVGEGYETVVLFCGHTHYPMWCRWTSQGNIQLKSIRYFQPMPLGKGVMVINPGSVGQPRDGDNRAAYAIFDEEAKTVEFRRVIYPVHESVAVLQNEGYPESLAERLKNADGKADLQYYETVYRRPQWDLEAINNIEID